MSDTHDPTFVELRHEAFSTCYRLLSLTKGQMDATAILHLGLFLGTADKILDLLRDYHRLVNDYGTLIVEYSGGSVGLMEEIERLQTEAKKLLGVTNG